MNANKRSTHTASQVDPDDAPELTEAFFERADEYAGEKLVRRGRPPAHSRKQLLTVRYDVEVVDAFKASGQGWQTRMNDALRDWLKDHTPA